MVRQPQRHVPLVRPPDRSAPSRNPSLLSHRVIVLSNRAPFRHEHAADGSLTIKRSASGLVTALEPLVEAYSGTWVAHGAGSADMSVVDHRDGLDVPPANPRYRLRYVAMADDEHRRFYYGFANEGLWPLCHAVNVPPIFRSLDFQMYRTANARFAAAVCDEAAGHSPLVLVQDYHFALAPRMLRSRLPSSSVVAFWHIPWPSPDVFKTCPWAEPLLEGLLGSDVVGLQTTADCVNFLRSVESLLGATLHRRDRDTLVWHRGRSTRVREYPVGIEWGNPVVRSTPPVRVCREQVCRTLGLAPDARIGIGIDRLDYTKGIHQKFLAVERLLERQPDLRERFVFVQVAEPSRDCLPAYRAARAQLRETSARVNARFGTNRYQPVMLLETHHEPDEVYRLYRAADLCYVGSLHDGMNLVAKEFVCARDDERGVLVLSQCAGAARQLDAALTVDPRAVDSSADVLLEALGMPSAEQAMRMQRLRANVATFDARWWAHQLVHDALQESASACASSDWLPARPRSASARHGVLTAD